MSSPLSSYLTNGQIFVAVKALLLIKILLNTTLIQTDLAMMATICITLGVGK